MLFVVKRVAFIFFRAHSAPCVATLRGHNALTQTMFALYSEIAKQFAALFILKKKFLLICRVQRKKHEVPAVNNYAVVIMAVYQPCEITTRNDNPKRQPETTTRSNPALARNN